MAIDVSKYPNVNILSHPLLKHKITHLRDINTGTNEFRNLVKEIAILEGYEALKNLHTELIEIQTPVEKTMQPVVSGKKLCFVPILRAGLGMVDGLLELVPSAKVGHIGLYRDEKTHLPQQYYFKMPNNMEERDVYLLDPMLATGGSAIDSVSLLKKHGAKNITFICIIAAPEGIENFVKANPEIPLYVGAVDRCLNDKAYICPGLGDCGDRIFGTVEN
ncbi:MAG: uracil phosphoribosyltransferase [Candidatus Enterosoma sp.]|nr:uracil phosphoribosyltransferase [Bacilli bacterium]MDD7607176.1 uracil phosphoribosyltransferase [bacterium]MDY3907144.1 uracil phosphoribosyltransferase [Candidatus Enterosoma sp.]MDY5649934.1 uracil phosphoribosyltransferase [Candidatus Enterosoma sp.]MDY5865629.1 uracil phosphoribosyltransferase [Candidatus Enterosoma sp.]